MQSSSKNVNIFVFDFLSTMINKNKPKKQPYLVS